MGNQNAKHTSKAASFPGAPPTEHDGLISFQTYGEATTVPVQIRRAVFDASDPASFLRRYLASLELTVVNTAVRKDISGKLRIALPVGSTVKKFEVLRTDLPTPQWYPAVAVPKKKAKEVVYKEIEKGRDVAAVSDVASGSNVFEIEVSPLPFGVEIKCRMECMLTGKVEDFEEMAKAYFTDKETEVIVTAADGYGQVSPKDEANVQADADIGGAVVGESFGKTHFVCRVPPIMHRSSQSKSEEKDTNKIKRIAVVWDASASMSKAANLLQGRLERLRELAVECNKHVESPLIFELYTFGIGAAVKEGVFDNVEDLLSTIAAIDYDGGTDATELSALFAQLSQRRQDSKSAEDDCNSIDSVLVFTDGMDNIGRLPQFEGLHSVPFPVHVVADSDKVNLRCCRAIASTSPQYPGSIFSQKDDSYVSGVLYPQAILRSIKTDQSEDAFMEEVDDGFRCVPDHRLQYLNQVIGSEGLLISGILGGEAVRSVSKVVAQVAYGSELHEYSFQLWDDAATDGKMNKKAKTTHCQEDANVHHYEAMTIPLAKEMEQASSKPIGPARILGYIYAEETYRAAESFEFKSGMGIEAIREELAVQYGFCSPESSLLMLYKVEQFLENGVLPPEEHPVFNDERIIRERKKRKEQEKKSQATGSKSLSKGDRIAEGQIGGPKTEEQKKKVTLLAKELERYLSSPTVLAKELQRLRGSGGRSLGRLENLYEAEDCRRCDSIERQAASIDRRHMRAAFRSVNLGSRPMHRQQQQIQQQQMPPAPPTPPAPGPPPPPGGQLNMMQPPPPGAPMGAPPAPMGMGAPPAPSSPMNAPLAPPVPMGGAPPPPGSGGQQGTASPFAMQMVAESREVGMATLDELEMQRRQIENIDREALRIEDVSCAARSRGARAMSSAMRSLGRSRDRGARACAMTSARARYGTSAQIEGDFRESVAMDMSSTLSSGMRGASDGSPTRGASDIRRDHSAVAPSRDSKLYAEKIEASLKKESKGCGWLMEYQAQREKMSGSGVPSPSFFLTCARLALKYSKTFDAIKIATNCLEMEVEDVQMLRCVAYFLLSTKDDKGIDLAQQLFDKVQELQPCEPQSFLDSALVRFWRVASCSIDNVMANSDKQKELADRVVGAQSLIARVLTHSWADRFNEVEWPALILLNYVAAYVKEINEKLRIRGTKDALPEWPTSALASYQSKVAKVLDWGADPLRCSKFDLALMVWMGWDSDKTDVDLHVVEPTKNEVYYGNRTSSIGSHLSRDFTQGYGPEVYILKDHNKGAAGLSLAGKYDIYAKYYASHQDSALTGTTSVLLWTIEKNKKSGEHSIDFLNVRLDTHKEKTKVKTVQLEGI